MRRPSGTRKFITVTAALCAAVVFPAHATELERQRALFTELRVAVERGDWRPVDALPDDERRLLEQYVLWPDLEALYLRATLKKAEPKAVEDFLDEHGTLKPARELRYYYALELARRGEQERFLDVYQHYYHGMNVARLDCLALAAEVAQERGPRIVERARSLWLVGYSQVPECDGVFSWLGRNGHLDTADYERRYALAVEARQFGLARWLARKLDAEKQAEAGRWVDAHENPERFLLDHPQLGRGAVVNSQLAYAAARLADDDAVRADALWREVARGRALSARSRDTTLREIALSAAKSADPSATTLMRGLPPAVVDDEVLTWRAQASLRTEAWEDLLDDIDALPDDVTDRDKWHYWRAQAMRRSGNRSGANALFDLLAGERSYYGFLAADAVGEPYAFGHDALEVDEAAIDALARRPALVRARELFEVGLESRGRSEWQAEMSQLTTSQRADAAVLAHGWGWHSRAIATAAAAGAYDDLALRYPLPFRESFERHAGKARIAATWALGIARSESLFMRDIRSRAGAVGLMQLLPSTGRRVAREINLPYSGIATLVDPEANIRLGTAYLGQMAARYDGHPVLATAAYNAGPHRVDAWLPERGEVDARVWIERIPYGETRRYVQRVLAAEAIFHWRLTGSTQRVTERLAAVAAPAADQRVASASR